MEFCVGDFVYLKDAKSIREISKGILTDNCIPFCGHIYVITGFNYDKWCKLGYTAESNDVVAADGEKTVDRCQFLDEWLVHVSAIQEDSPDLDDFFGEM